ncbi:hypothetical protein HanXRQr2_Chr04g0178841 [Helianthus annuus]|uniref:Uncharacterized protein n=1 Tax=Helianthus annuus TaxID=4232 RepID=A0A9K3J9E0_HELAN|nr:hypothetical protein HanXRQr2_Chr04g0178841 [Helianthus annuus]
MLLLKCAHHMNHLHLIGHPAQLSHTCLESPYTGQRAIEISLISHLSLYAYDLNSSPNLPFYHLCFRDHIVKWLNQWCHNILLY